MSDIVELLHNLSDDLNAHSVGELWAGLDEAADEIERLRVENWQLKGALGYPVPSHIMDNSDFKCGLCEAKTLDIIEATAEIERLRARLAVLERFVAGVDG